MSRKSHVKNKIYLDIAFCVTYNSHAKTNRKKVNAMNETMYTSEVMAQAGTVYDRLNSMPPEKRNLMTLMADAYLSGMLDRDQLATRTGERREGT